jgi:hypothetical protein
MPFNPTITYGDGRYYWSGNAAGIVGGAAINFVGDPRYLTGTCALTWSILQAATDGSKPQIVYNTGAGAVTTAIGSSGSPQAIVNESGQIDINLASVTGIQVNVTSTGGTVTTGALPWIVAVAITRNANESLPWDFANPFDPVAYNPSITDNNGYPSSTLLQLRTRIINRLGFIPPNPVDATATFTQLQARVTARCGFIPLLAEVPGLTLLQMQTYLMNRLGFANQASNPPPGMAATLTAIINEAQQGLYRRYTQGGYADAAPALLVNSTDTLTLDNLAVQLLACATAKVHYGQPDGQVIGNQYETYLKELMARTPPNLTAVLKQNINSAIQTIWRRYAYEVNGVITTAAPAQLVAGSDVCPIDALAVELLASALTKGIYGQKDAAYVAQEVETYLTETLKRQPPNIVAIVNDLLLSAQTYLYRRYTALHTKRLFRWKVNPGQRFYGLTDNDENVLANYHMDPNKTIEWVGIQDSRNVWYPLIEGIPPQLFTMITKPWRPARYKIGQAIELYPAPDQTYWLWIRAHFGLMSFVNDTDTTTLDSELVFLQALATAKAHYGQADAATVAAEAGNYRKELIAGTHATAHYIPGTIAVPPAVRPTLIGYQDNQSG